MSDQQQGAVELAPLVTIDGIEVPEGWTIIRPQPGQTVRVSAHRLFLRDGKPEKNPPWSLRIGSGGVEGTEVLAAEVKLLTPPELKCENVMYTGVPVCGAAWLESCGPVLYKVA